MLVRAISEAEVMKILVTRTAEKQALVLVMLEIREAVLEMVIPEVVKAVKIQEDSVMVTKGAVLVAVV